MIPSLIPWLQERVAALKKTPELLYLHDDIANLTAMRDLLVSGMVEMEAPDLARTLAIITLAKTNAVRTMTIEGRTVVPIAEFRRTIEIFIGLFRKYVPIEDQPALLEDLRLGTRYDEPVNGAG